MYPTLYHAFLDLFGIDIPFLKLLNSFGFFVALAFITASYLLSLELKRLEKFSFFPSERIVEIKGAGPKWSEVFTNAFFGFILGWKLIYLLVNASHLFAHGLAQRALFTREGYVLLGVVLALVSGFYTWYTAKKKQLPKPESEYQVILPHMQVGTITFVAAIAGMSGAKLFHLLENPKEFMDFFKHPSLESFISGLTVYGGIIVGSVVVLLWAKKKNWHLMKLADAAAPGMILAYGIGRIGCQVSGDGDWGIDNPDPMPSWLSFLPDWFWSYDYPNNVNGVGVDMISGTVFPGYGTHLSVPVFPTPLYETLLATLIFLVLWYFRKRVQVPGTIFCGYLILNGVERFFVEQIRVNNFVEFAGMRWTQAMVIALVFIAIGSMLLLYLRKTHHDVRS